MPQTSSASLDHFPSFLARLPADLDVEALARTTKAFQRRRGVRSGTDLLRLSLAWGPGAHSLQRVAAWAGACGIAHLTDEALIQRLHAAGPFLQAVTNQLLKRRGHVACWHGRVLRIADSTSLSRPGSQGTDWRVHGVYDLGCGGFSHLEITDRHGGEALDRGQPVAGEIRIGDRGYANAQAWHRFAAAAGDGQADYIVRMRWNTVRLVDQAGARFDIIAWLAALPPDSQTHEVLVQAQPGRHQQPLPIRLVARRKTPQAIEAADRQLLQRASRKQTRPDPRSHVAAAYVVLATSLPAEDFAADDVLAAYRLRWQIELAFKRLKSIMKIADLRTRTEAGTRCWLYAHLIVALLCDDLSQDILDSFPSGPCRRGGNHIPVAHDPDRLERHHDGRPPYNHAEHALAPISHAA